MQVKYGILYLNGGKISSNSTVATLYFTKRDGFKPNDTVRPSIPNYVENTNAKYYYYEDSKTTNQ